MISRIAIIFTVIQLCYGNQLKFPKNFLFGVASSSYQVEGAWNEDGKGESIWDRYSHEHPDRILDGSNGDIACDSYHLYQEDVNLLDAMGVDFYRFSLSWPRILPNGLPGKINPAGVLYYNRLIDALLAKDIKPVVTLYHWDLPVSLQDAGGWPNPLIADYFADYARVAFQHFGDRVKTWITLNEPYHICQTGYGTGMFAPGHLSYGLGMYMCSYTAMLAHAKAYHIYDKEFRGNQQGEIGITIDSFWYEPKRDTKIYRDAVELTIQMAYGWFVHPIYSEQGGFPQAMKDQVLKVSLAENLTRSRLPEFTADEVEFIKGTSDFLGLNHYSTFVVSMGNDTDSLIMFASTDIGVNITSNPAWEGTVAPWLRITPWGFRKLLNWIKNEYGNPKVVVTESGCVDGDGDVNDPQRVKYYKSYLEELLKAIHEDGCNVTAYTAWSLLDNYEWNSGYAFKFGLHYVDFSDPNRKRTPKASSIYYKKVISTRHTDHKYESVPLLLRSGAFKPSSLYILINLIIFYTSMYFT